MSKNKDNGDSKNDKNTTRPKSAVALHYDGQNTPTITAKGKGELAGQIIALAKEHGIPLQENTVMVELLSQLDLGAEIPDELFRAVAEIIAFAYLLSGKLPAGYSQDHPSS